MPTLTVRQLDEDTYKGLKARAELTGRSMEAEARVILEHSVSNGTWWQRWIELTETLRGEELPLPVRSAHREPPDFS